MTNGERLRDMTDEQLAKELAAMEACPPIECDNCDDMIDCEAGLLKWLKSESREDGCYISEVRIYDKEELYTDCTVQVLTNTVTGDTSIGWWQNNKTEDDT